MQALFLAVAILGAFYFVARRRIDPMTVAFGASLIYFAPAFFGISRFSYGVGYGAYDQVTEPGAYWAMIIVLGTVGAVSLAVDRLPVGQVVVAPFERLIAPVLLTVALGAGAVSLFTVGRNYLCVDKQLTLDHIDKWYYYAAYAVPLGLLAAVCSKQWLIASICAVMLAADIFIGFRTDAAVSFISILVLFGGWLFQGRGRAATFVAILILGGAGFFMVKELSYNIKTLGSVWCAPSATSMMPKIAPAPAAPPSSAKVMGQIGRMVFDPSTYMNAIANSEPFVIEALLNEVVRTNFKTDPSYLSHQLLTGLPGGESIFKLDLGPVPSFESFYRPALFPDVPFGMAANPWAQAFAAGGLGMVFVFALGYALLVGGLSWLYWRSGGALRGGILVTAVWIAFYFHRNDLMTEVGILKQTVYTFLVACLLAWATWLALRRVSRRSQLATG
jgi:hypothetical protein